jgi:hypothetical protein
VTHLISDAFIVFSFLQISDSNNKVAIKIPLSRFVLMFFLDLISLSEVINIVRTVTTSTPHHIRLASAAGK